MSVFLFSGFSVASRNFSIEGGGVRSLYNLQRSPGDGGSTFDLASSFDESTFFYRLNFKMKTQKNSGVRVLYAPLKIEGSYRYDRDIEFEEETFSQNEKIETLYQFNSYRVSYFWNLKNSKKFLMDLGGTLKVRDAKVRLKQGSKKEMIENIGFVPLIYLYGEYRFDGISFVSFDFDGLVAPQGRAVDAGLFYGLSFSKNLRASLGWRILEGGADNKKVFNSALFQFYSMRLEFIF
jgi:hypothetical protein